MKTYHFLHPELMSPEAPDVILAKIKNLEDLKEQKYKLFELSNELEARIAAEEKELNSIKGVLYECIEEPDNQPKCKVEKINLYLKGVSNSKF